MVDYHNYFTTVHLLMKTGVAYWLAAAGKTINVHFKHSIVGVYYMLNT